MSREDLRITPSWAGVILTVTGMIGGSLLYIGNLKYAPRDDYARKADVDSVMSVVRRVSEQQEGLNARIDVLLLSRMPIEARQKRDRTGRRQ